MAIAGLVVGYVMGAWGVLSLSGILPREDLASAVGGYRWKCERNLKSIGLGCYTYSMDYNDYFPDNLSNLYPHYISLLDIFVCPNTGDQVLSPERIEEDGSYVYIRGFTEKGPKDTLLMHDKPTNHGLGRNELYLGARVEWKPDNKQD